MYVNLQKDKIKTLKTNEISRRDDRVWSSIFNTAKLAHMFFVCYDEI